jgi:IMP cyclohydrolase
LQEDFEFDTSGLFNTAYIGAYRVGVGSFENRKTKQERNIAPVETSKSYGFASTFL